MGPFRKKIRAPRQLTLPDAREHSECLTLLRTLRVPIIHACCQTLYACGLRIGEGIGLRPQAVDGPAHILHIRGKGAKERNVPLPHALYLHLRKVWTLHKNPHFLFARESGGNHLSESAVREALKAVCLQTGIRHVTPHVFRHSYATRMLERGIHTSTLQILLGHADPRTTMTYLHLTEPLRNDVQRVADDLVGDLLA